jgi:sugar (pentulose or hexulose) kinase
VTAAILDIGKSRSKLSLAEDDGTIVASLSRANARCESDGVACLDTEGIATWLTSTLAEWARTHRITAIVPVAHGATAAFITANGLAAPVRDYEADPPAAIARAYESDRDPFDRTLSPRLPHGLNLGVQLAWQEHDAPALREARICLWPQFWAWRLSGQHAAEATSLGCHTDLWFPVERRYGSFAERRGWAQRMGPLTAASAVLGNPTPAYRRATGLPSDCAIHCGLHDSNAALLAARRHREVAGRPFVLVSTGTWFVAMQSGKTAMPVLDEMRDMLANVDIAGLAVPSARFMGGREYESIAGKDIATEPTILAAHAIMRRGVLALPSFATGTGPFPRAAGAVRGRVETGAERAALASLYLALMTDTMLDAMSADGPVLLEGRFAANAVFAATLAALRESAVYLLPEVDGIAQGCMSLIHPGPTSPPRLRASAPLSGDVVRYRERWRAALLNPLE